MKTGPRVRTAWSSSRMREDLLFKDKLHVGVQAVRLKYSRGFALSGSINFLNCWTKQRRAGGNSAMVHLPT